jgi:riboflavin biosynthesis pyrimidine reductase
MIKEYRLTHESARNNAINLIKQLPLDKERPLRIIIDEDNRTSAQNRLIKDQLSKIDNK